MNRLHAIAIFGIVSCISNDFDPGEKFSSITRLIKNVN